MGLPAGTLLGRFEIIAPIGAGGMGDVYAARDPRLQRTVAIKVCREEFSARFEREARAVAALNHPHICTLHDLGPNYLVMELVEGITLAERIADGPLAAADALRIARQIADALTAAHDTRIVHRDLKPANIKITPAGLVKVLDFGLARTDEDPSAAADAPTITGAPRTVAGVALGTVAYMSPEQAEGLPVDHRTDLWSLGIVLYQMLAGRTPFEGGTTQRTILDILQKPAAPLPGVPRELQRVIDRCLQKEREARYQSADALLHDLDACATPADAPGRAILAAVRRPRIAVPVTLALVALVAAAGWGLQRARNRQWARLQAIPEVHRLADRGEFAAAYRLAVDAERYIAGDPALQSVWTEVAHAISVETTPAGAEVSWKIYNDPEASWQPLGATPITGRRMPAMPLRLRVTKPGYAPLEVAAPLPEYRFTLTPEHELPPDMVQVPGGSRREYYAGLGELAAPVGRFAIDRHEVTNRQFKAFVDGGGYRNHAYWSEPFVEDGHTLSRDSAMAQFVDQTGRPGPSTWEAGGYPEGRDDHPVTGVSWYEAAAYAAFARRQLPTIYHWFRAANPDDSPFLLPFSNFAGGQPRDVGRSHALGSHGVLDMAGNVREWCLNESATTGQRYILGGSWTDQSYMLMRGQLAPAFDRSSTNGFRCARYPADAGGRETLTTAVTPAPFPAYLTAPPATEDVFGAYASVYAYEPADLKPVVESTDDSTDLWRREKISFEAGYGGERITAYLFLPRRGTPPYRCVVVMPSGSALRKEPGESIRPESYILRSGRAMLYPVFKHTYERYTRPPSYEPLVVRDAMIAWRQDLGRSIDYLQTRRDIDASKLAYFGYSMGAEVAPILLAMERRFSAAVLLSGGLAFFLGRLPEMNAVNFLPRVTTPVLMINGKYDSILPVATAQEPFFQRLGTPAADKRHVVLDAGHTVETPETHTALLKEVLDWLDKYLQ